MIDHHYISDFVSYIDNMMTSWLVVFQPLWEILVSWDDEIPNWMEK